VDVGELEEAGRQFDQNLAEIVAQNSKVANYVSRLESREDETEPDPESLSELPPASQLVEEIEQFLRRQRPE